MCLCLPPPGHCSPNSGPEEMGGSEESTENSPASPPAPSPRCSHTKQNTYTKGFGNHSVIQSSDTVQYQASCWCSTSIINPYLIVLFSIEDWCLSGFTMTLKWWLAAVVKKLKRRTDNTNGLDTKSCMSQPSMGNLLSKCIKCSHLFWSKLPVF